MAAQPLPIPPMRACTHTRTHMHAVLGVPTLPHSSGRSREAEEPVARGTESPLRSRPAEGNVGAVPGRAPDPPAPLPSRARHPHGTQHPGACLPGSVRTQARWEVPEQEGRCKVTSHSSIVPPSPALGSGT